MFTQAEAGADNVFSCFIGFCILKGSLEQNFFGSPRSGPSEMIVFCCEMMGGWGVVIGFIPAPQKHRDRASSMPTLMPTFLVQHRQLGPGVGTVAQVEDICLVRTNLG